VPNIASENISSFNPDTIIAYFLGVLRVISYGSKVFIEGRGLLWKRLMGISSEILNEVRDTI